MVGGGPVTGLAGHTVSEACRIEFAGIEGCRGVAGKAAIGLGTIDASPGRSFQCFRNASRMACCYVEARDGRIETDVAFVKLFSLLVDVRLTEASGAEGPFQVVQDGLLAVGDR